MDRRVLAATLALSAAACRDQLVAKPQDPSGQAELVDARSGSQALAQAVNRQLLTQRK